MFSFFFFFWLSQKENKMNKKWTKKKKKKEVYKYIKCCCWLFGFSLEKKNLFCFVFRIFIWLLVNRIEIVSDVRKWTNFVNERRTHSKWRQRRNFITVERSSKDFEINEKKKKKNVVLFSLGNRRRRRNGKWLEFE